MLYYKYKKNSNKGTCQASALAPTTRNIPPKLVH